MILRDVHPTTYAVLDRLLDEVLALDPNDRAKWIESLPDELTRFAPRLAALLAHAEQTGERLRFDTIPKIESEPLAAGTEVGPYRLLRLLGEGGMGEVWLAERTDGIMNRPVALKLPRGLRARMDLPERLAREREILASLSHPNISRLYDAGLTEEGRPFLALEYIEGKPIDEYVEGLDIRARVRLGTQIADAVAHAHARLVIHRDIKPSNILVTEDGRAHLLDFGIAKLLEDGSAEDTDLTRETGRALTIAYASPEQIRGERLTVASDIYSLGVVLYELLTGARAYQQMLHGAPRRPSEVAPPESSRMLRGDLDTILLKALEKEPGDRYASAGALKDDLERHLGGHPVLAQPDRALYRMRKFVARHRLSVGAVAIAIGALVGGAGVSLWQARVALAEKERAEQAKEFVVSILTEADPWDGSNPRTLIDLLARARKRVDERFAPYPRLRAEILAVLGTSMGHSGDYLQAEAILRDAIAQAKVAHGPIDPFTLNLRMRLLDVLFYLEKMDEMRREIDEILTIVRADPSMPREELIRALQMYSMAKAKKAWSRDAQQAAEEGYQLARAHLGPQHEGTLSLATSVGFAALDGPDPDAAVELTHRAVQLAEEMYGTTPQPRGIDARSLYGRALARSGRTEEAVRVLERVIEEAVPIMGAEHALVGVVSGFLAREYSKQGKIEPAIAAGDRAVAILGKAKEPRSASTANALLHRGTALLTARRSEAALADLVLARDILTETSGADHPRTIEAKIRIGLALARLGRLDEATRAVQGISASTGFDEASYVRGVIQRLAGEHAAALRSQEAALRSEEKQTHERARAELELALAMAGLGNRSEAIAKLEALLAARKHASPERAEALAVAASCREGAAMWKELGASDPWRCE